MIPNALRTPLGARIRVAKLQLVERLNMSVAFRKIVIAFTGMSAIAGAVLFSPCPARAQTAAEFVRSIGNDALAAARAHSQSRFRSLLRDNADLPSIAMFVLGPYRAKMPNERRGDYFLLFEKYLTDVFLSNASKLAGRSLDIQRVKSQGRNILVWSRIAPDTGRRPVSVIWRLVEGENGYKIFDVNIAGIWLAVQQRTNFVALLDRNNGNIEALFKFLRER